MFYEPGTTGHGLRFDPFKSCVVPRPIGWISTTSALGIDNLAPYSQFQNVTFDPPTVLFIANQRAGGGRKDTVVNAETTGEFVWNIATYDLRDAVNCSSEEFAPDVDEFDRARLAKLPSVRVRPPRVAVSPIQFECRYMQTVRVPGDHSLGTVDIVLGRVVAVHIDDRIIVDGKIDLTKVRPLARLGYFQYCSVDEVFEMEPPPGEELRAGLEGSPEKAHLARGSGGTRRRGEPAKGKFS